MRNFVFLFFLCLACSDFDKEAKNVKSEFICRKEDCHFLKISLLSYDKIMFAAV